MTDEAQLAEIRALLVEALDEVRGLVALFKAGNDGPTQPHWRTNNVGEPPEDFSGRV